MSQAGNAAYAAGVTVASAVSTGPVIVDIGGIPVPVVPALAGVLAVLLVRVMVVTKSAPGFRIYNVSLTLLCMLVAAGMVIDHRLGVGQSIWAGIGCGALGVSLVEIGKSQFGAALKAGLQTMLKGMAGGGKRD